MKFFLLKICFLRFFILALLQIFPSERHGVRSIEAGEFHDASMLSFLCRALAVDRMHSNIM